MARHSAIFSILSGILLLSVLGCAKGFQSQNLSLESLQSSDTPSTPAPGPEPMPFRFKPLLWEDELADSKAWSDFVFSLLRTEAHALLEAQDFSRFCGRFDFLSEDQKVNAAGMLISAIVKYESGFNPLARLLESSLGTDVITGLPVYSEGLMQLSYQDVTARPYCQFDWEKDRNLSPTDPNKTILDPFINLDCGVRILAQQIQNRGRIVLSSGAYWSVLKEGGPYEKIDEIAALVSTLEFCR